MLVLTRKLSEGILIGDNIKITVVGIEGDRIKLGIDAPQTISVIREELIVAVGQENRMAALSEYRPCPIIKEI